MENGNGSVVLYRESLAVMDSGLMPSACPGMTVLDYALLKNNPQHPSLHFKKVGRFWSVRVGLRYRALGAEVEDGLLWFWIGSHADYDEMIG